MTSTDTSQEQTALESKQLAIYDVILSVSQAHHTHCAVTEDKIKVIQRKPATLVSRQLEKCLTEFDKSASPTPRGSAVRDWTTDKCKLASLMS